MLRESQTAADKLDRQVREQREALEELAANEASLRKKLERARSERAVYRASAERLQRDVKTLDQDRAVVPVAAAANTDAIVRAAAVAEQRHVKEIRGMCMQMEWLQARCDRETRLRADAAYAKRYLLLELQVRDAWYVYTLCIFLDLSMQSRTSWLTNTFPSQTAIRQTLSSSTISWAS
jgi:hypothetical protein